MSSQHKLTTRSTDQLRVELLRLLQNLLNHLHASHCWMDALLDALAVLNALPLTSHEFAVATNRLQNAQRYLTADEPGPARFELQLLLGSLKTGDDQRPIHRRFRRRAQ